MGRKIVYINNYYIYNKFIKIVEMGHLLYSFLYYFY